MTTKSKTKTKPKKKTTHVTLSKYLILLRERGIKSTHQTLHNRKNKGELDFVVGGDTPEYKIDISKYPPSEYKKQKGGRKKTA